LKTVATTTAEWSGCGCGWAVWPYGRMAMGIWGLDFDFDLAFEFERSGAHEGGLHFVVAAADEGFWLATLKVPFPAHFCRPFCFLPISIPNTLRRPLIFLLLFLFSAFSVAFCARRQI